ncbi:MBL fold metallo-hydrolase [Rhodoplanes sp. TEM]|uniref:MBL fold metallo-hydrolase n=1 Tax=Rhodoplanes tepidamans TaxID=200616 RepID=A0ABT5J7R6_RHOTP|nr:MULTISPECIES: MBL fold metallo-hydrolase [Rhodoplanes]MDC7785695.1 MBL fold metallo-hydrolase [Rhodoplanes tepidamans]MDC7983336.1 MBL fold metallo-hydrolase [Rhodoplanes sp. TEM]
MTGGSSTGMLVRFWGVRGSVTCPGPATVRYGGNTACVEVRCGHRLVIFDAGSGLRGLGLALAAGGETAAPAPGRPLPVDADIFFSHCHLDHVWGLPFFQPAYEPGTRLRLWAGHLLPETTLAAAIRQLVAHPLFPGGGDLFRADIAFEDFRCGETLTPHPGMVLRTGPLQHPGGGTGYRLEYGGASLAYVTDTEHRAGQLDPAVLALAADVDLFVYDCTYTEAEYAANAGRGHSTWQHGVRLASAAGARRLAIFHHDPSHDDPTLDRIAREAEAMRPGTLVATEGLTLRLPAAPPARAPEVHSDDGTPWLV